MNDFPMPVQLCRGRLLTICEVSSNTQPFRRLGRYTAMVAIRIAARIAASRPLRSRNDAARDDSSADAATAAYDFVTARTLLPRAAIRQQLRRLPSTGPSRRRVR